jgi:hypothetical protein
VLANPTRNGASASAAEKASLAVDFHQFQNTNTKYQQGIEVPNTIKISAKECGKILRLFRSFPKIGQRSCATSEVLTQPQYRRRRRKRVYRVLNYAIFSDKSSKF